MEAAERYNAQDPNPLWLGEIKDDDECVSRFMAEVTASDTLTAGQEI
jgi:hypothetical protein